MCLQGACVDVCMCMCAFLYVYPLFFLLPSLPPFLPPSPPQPGLRGTYQGLTATIIKQGSNPAIRFFVYTSLKKWFQGGDNRKDIGNIRTFLIGGIAGAASVFGNTPVDVVKTRMQVCVSPGNTMYVHVCFTCI